MLFSTSKLFALMLTLGYVSAITSTSQIGHIIHQSSRKLIHPLGGSASPADNTRLVIHRGGLGQSRLQLQFERDPDSKEGYGYIKHVRSGKYVHPYGGSLWPGDDTPLVYHSGKHAACLFLFDVRNDYIIHKSSQKIWHPLGGSGNPSDNTVAVLHRGRHDRAKFFLANSRGVKILPSPVGHIVHRSSGKLIHPLGGSANPADNTRLVIHRGGLGQSRLLLQFERDPSNCEYGYIRHVPSGKYVHPLGGSLQPSSNTPLVYHRGKHGACLFLFDECNEYVLHKSSGKIWHPLGASDNTAVVLHHNRHSWARFLFATTRGSKVSP